MVPAVEVAIIAGAVSFIVGGITSMVSVWIYHNQSRTEANAVKTAKKLLQQKQYKWRTFEMLKRRLGGFNEDEVRKILVRAGAVRFYQRWEDIYETSEAEVHADLPDKLSPVEVWGRVEGKYVIPYLGRKPPFREPEHGVVGFPCEKRQQKDIHSD